MAVPPEQSGGQNSAYRSGCHNLIYFQPFRKSAPPIVNAGVTQTPAITEEVAMIDTSRRLDSNDLPVCSAPRRIRSTGLAANIL